MQSRQSNNQLTEFTPTDEGSYFADLNWVKTSIDISKKGYGTVRMVINCTPSDEHFGIYIRPITSGEVDEIIPAETFAVNDGQTLAVNYSAASAVDLSYRIYLEQPDLLNENETIQYYFSYTADFFGSQQIKHYEVDTTLASINLDRPYWDGTLLLQELEVVLPVNVGESNVTQAFLDQISFSVSSDMTTYYSLNYSTKFSDGNYWLVFTSQKTGMPAFGPFKATFYLSYEYFSLPAAISWVAGLMISLLVIGAVTVLTFVVIIRKKTKEEVDEFKEGLYELIITDEQ
jgi:hypothetical protein